MYMYLKSFFWDRVSGTSDRFQSPYVAKDDFEHLILLPLPLKYWDYGCTPLHRVYIMLETEHKALNMISEYSTNWATSLGSLLNSVQELNYTPSYIRIYFVICIGVLCASCISEHRMHAWYPQRPEEGVKSPATGITHIVSCHMDRCLELNPGHLEELWVLLPLNHLFGSTF